MEVVVTTGAIRRPVKSSSPTNQHPVFLQAVCPSCHPTNSVKALNFCAQSADLSIKQSVYIVTSQCNINKITSKYHVRPATVYRAQSNSRSSTEVCDHSLLAFLAGQNEMPVHTWNLHLTVGEL